MSTTPPPVPFIPVPKKQNHFISFVKNHKLASSVTIAILGWFLFIVVSCSQSGEIIQLSSEATQINSKLSTLQTNASKVNSILSATPVVIIVTPTFTSTPLYTPTITLTPTNTPLPTKTPIPSATPKPTATTDPLTMPIEDGNYLVNVDIAPGVWRSNGDSSDCYWEITTMTGDIINNYIGAAGGTMYINKSAFAVRMERCGTWTFYAKP